ncbi:MAG: ABC transporter permease [Acidimicrobiia bacterium]
MQDFFLFAMLGLGSGAVYAILGLGLVLVYRGSGVVNFAYGAMAMIATFQYVDMVEGGMRETTALALTLAMSAIGGVLLYLLIFRPLRDAPALAKIVASLGLLLALQQLAVIQYGTQTRVVQSILPDEVVTLFDVSFGRNRLWLFVVTVVIATFLWALYKFSLFGIATQAAAENEKGAVLLGYSPTLIGAANWALAAVLAALAGILIAPITSLTSTGFTLLIIPALAAALLGRFTSFAITAAAGIAIGIGQSEITRYWDQPGAKDALPFVVIILAMVATGKLVPSRGSLSAGRSPLAPVARLTGSRVALASVGVLAAVAGLYLFDRSLQSALLTTLMIAIVALSLVVITGFVGQISLAQMTFAGLGALFVSKLADGSGVPFPLSILLAAVITVPAGIVLGLPALRVRGVNLAVVTIGAAVAVQSMVFDNGDITGGLDGSPVPDPTLFGVDLAPIEHPERYGVFVLVVLVLLAVAVSNLRRGSVGRRWLAVRHNERAAAASGINVAAVKLQAFALSAFVAALAGGMLAYMTNRVAFGQFSPLQSIFVVAIGYIGGIASVGGALIAGMMASGGFFYSFLGEFFDSGRYDAVFSGVLLILIAIFYPDGVSVAIGRSWAWARRRLGLAGPGTESGGEEPDGTDGSEAGEGDASLPVGAPSPG